MNSRLIKNECSFLNGFFKKGHSFSISLYKSSSELFLWNIIRDLCWLWAGRQWILNISLLWNNENNFLSTWYQILRNFRKLKVTALYLMCNPEICQDPPSCGQDDLFLLIPPWTSKWENRPKTHIELWDALIEIAHHVTYKYLVGTLARINIDFDLMQMPFTSCHFQFKGKINSSL